MKRLTEIIQYDHKDIKILVRVDHLNAKVSIVELEGIYDGGRSNFVYKKWMFANRGLEYMQGWQNILDAMKYAIGEATKLLEHDLAESSKFKNEQFEIIAIGLNDKKFPIRKKRKK